MALRKLGVVREIVESVGMNIGHAYDDLVFLDHNAFLLQFHDDLDTMIIHQNCEAEKESFQDALNILKGAAATHGMTFIEGTDYSLVQGDDENLRLEFLPSKMGSH